MAGTKANGTRTTGKGKRTSGSKASGGKSTGTRSKNQIQNQEEGFLRSEVLIIGSFALSVLLFLSNFHLCGIVGDYLRMAQLGIFGMVGFVAPVILFVGTCFFLANKGNPIAVIKLISVTAAVAVLCGLAEMFFGEGFKEGQKAAEAFFRSSESGSGGGFTGGLLVMALGSMLGTVGTYLVLLVLLAICGVCITERSLVALVKKGGGRAYQYAREDVERKRVVHEERKEEKRRLREEQKLRGVNLSSTKLDAWADEPEINEADEYPEERLEENDGYEPENRYQEYEEPKEQVITPADRFTGTIHRSDSYEAIEDSVPFEADKSEEHSEMKILFDNQHRGNNQELRVQKDMRTLGEMEITDDYCVPWSAGMAGSVDTNEYGAAQPSSAFDGWANQFHEGVESDSQRAKDFYEEDPGYVSQRDSYREGTGYSDRNDSYEKEACYSSQQESYEDRAGYGDHRDSYGEESGYRSQGAIYREESDFGNQEGPYGEESSFGTQERFYEEKAGYGSRQDVYREESEYGGRQDIYEEESGYEESSQNGQKDFDEEETGYKTESDFMEPVMENVGASQIRDGNAGTGTTIASISARGEFSIPEESKRVVTSTGKIIETDTEALKKKVEKRREEAIESGDVIVPSHMKEELIIPKEYEFPPIHLLKKGKSSSNSASDKEYRETAIKLQQTLRNFGVGVTVTNVSCGPSVTRYELHPEQGVKVSKIVGLADDIKLNLAAADIRIEAPIPGKSAVGIEVPNKENNVVYLRELLESEEFKNNKSKLAFAVGKDIGGQVVVTDVAKMPHLLIAGATGSGKSVCINTLIMSLIYKADPNDVKMIMIDPKVVELSAYNGIPHLLIPVVTDPKKASGALNWAVAEMMDRYQKFAQYNVRNLQGYNAKIESIKDIEDENKPQKMPLIVIIVDELADLMMVSPGEVEDAICRLAQLARAAGIHLVIATQRPSVNVITGLIKANVPSRIAFSVSSGVDSRTIIDMYGAEKLLGKGDMLFYPAGYQKPQRVQGAFVSDQEVAEVVEFLTAQNEEPVYHKEIESQIAMPIFTGPAESKGNGRDEYFAQAGKFIIEKEKGSIGMLQRMFKIGFNRAARIMDQLAEAGVVGEEEGTKPRKVLMTLEEFQEMLQE